MTHAPAPAATPATVVRWLCAIAVLTALSAACGRAPIAAPPPHPPSPSPSTVPAPKTGVETPAVVRPGAPGQPTRTAVAEPPSAAPRHSAADVHFMQGMIMHHAQAVVMTQLAPTRTRNATLLLMSRRIDVSQTNEMALMKSWLDARGETATMSHAAGDHDMQMPGMLTDRQLQQLAAARDAEFDRLFLTFMIQHHEGALRMVDALRAAGGAQEPELYQFVSNVDTDQRAEIERMRMMLN